MRRKQGRSGLDYSNLEVGDGLGCRREDTERTSSVGFRLKSNVRVGLAVLRTIVGVCLVNPLKQTESEPSKGHGGESHKKIIGA